MSRYDHNSYTEPDPKLQELQFGTAVQVQPGQKPRVYVPSG